jgi:hypothetical protein
VTHTCNANTGEAKAGLPLLRNWENSLGNIARPCLKEKKKGNHQSQIIEAKMF